MKKIEIVTSHNITVVYTLASAIQRLLASAIDFGIVCIYALFVTIGTGGVSVLFYLLVLPAVMFYHFLFELFNDGQSIGKKLMKLKVVTLSGRSPSTNDLFLRWIFRTIDVTLSFGTLAFLFIASSMKNQRIGDVVAETSVINLKSNQFIDLDSLNRIQESDRQIMYPEVTQYNDKDMLFVKDTLERVNRIPNKANRLLIKELSQRIETDLGIQNLTFGQKEFLKQVLSDYILLTR